MNGKTVKARREHQCELCKLPIKKGESYYKERITPWDHPDNEGYFTFKAHDKCSDVWFAIGDDYDWRYPDDGGYWLETMEAYLKEKAFLKNKAQDDIRVASDNNKTSCVADNDNSGTQKEGV